MITQKQLDKAYWKGFEDGKQNCLNHNIRLMKLQLESQKRIQKDTTSKLR